MSSSQRDKKNIVLSVYQNNRTVFRLNDKNLLQGMGELMDDDIKNFVRSELKSETIGLFKFYKEFPILR